MSTNLHELTKQLDVLTYNSRSVLNALIRSVMAAGSSTGWTVERAGVKLVMTRTDIFLLSSFYTEWEYTRFDKEQFDIIREKLDAQYADGKGMVSDTPVTYAIVQHAKIMTMNSADSDVADDEYWLQKVRDQVNPKLFTNSAPIPINIRTPIYDENLSTKHFDQFETYLFPRAYYTMDTLGYTGDNTTHIGGGREWFFDVDDKMTIGADRTVIGVQNPDIAEVREYNYQKLGTLNSIAGGTDSFAYAPNSTSIGWMNQVCGKDSAAVGGYGNFVYADDGGILAGTYNTVVSDFGAAVGGRSNSVTGDCGLAANERTNVGGYAFSFRRYVSSPNASTVTKCKNEIDEGDGCIYTLQISGTAGNGADVDGNIAPNQILITSNELKISGFNIGKHRITSAYDGGEYGYADFKVGDIVRLSRPRGLTAGVVDNMGSYLERKITALEMRSYGLVVTFDDSVNRFPGIKGEIYSGTVARYLAYRLPTCNEVGYFLGMENQIASASTALGYNTIAGGRHQTVVGESNYELMRPVFMVGNGSHYIDVDTYRHNAFVVAKSYSYLMTSSHYVHFGVSDYSTASHYIHGDSSYLDNRKYDEDYQLHGIEKYQGIYAYEMDSQLLDATRAVLRVSHKHTTLGIGKSGVVMHPMSTEMHPNSNTVLAELKAHDGAIGVHSGSWDFGDDYEPMTIENDWKTYYRQKVNRGGKDKSVTIWALDNIGIHGSNGIGIHTTKYIHGEYGKLTLKGDCLGALTADTSEPQGLMDFLMGSLQRKQDIAYLKYPGHYYVPKPFATVRFGSDAMYTDYLKAYHVISNTHYVSRDLETNSNVYSTAQLILPGNVTCGISEHYNHHLPHPKLQVTTVRFPDDIHESPADAGGFICQELAYLADVKDLENKTAAQYVGSSGITRTAAEGTTTYAKLCDVNFNSLVSAYAGASFTYTLRDKDGKNCQGYVSFSLGEHLSTIVYGKAYILYTRHDQQFDTSRVKIIIQPHGPDGCSIWFSTQSANTYIKTFKLWIGDAEVAYSKVTAHTETAPLTYTELPWEDRSTWPTTIIQNNP